MFKAFPTWIGDLKNIQIVIVIVIGEVSVDTMNLSFDKYNDLIDQMRSVSGDWFLVRETWQKAPYGTSDTGFERKGKNAASRFELMYIRENLKC